MTATWALDVCDDVIYVGHVAGLDDPTTPIYTAPVAIRDERGGPRLDLRCPTCPGRVSVFRGAGENNVGSPLDGHDFEAEPLVIVEHDDACAAFAEYRQWWTEAAR